MRGKRLEEYTNAADVDADKIPDVVYDEIADCFLNILLRAAADGALSEHTDTKLAV